jgi:putative phosphoserine phosphatase/1-acylglycerol-3-phosphate O-acyltransferase
MSLYPEVTAEIEALPDGPQIGAFFDFDGTIIGGYSVVPFVRALVGQGHLSLRGLAQKLTTGVSFARGRTGLSSLLAELSSELQGRPESDYLALADKLFEDQIAKMIYPETRTMIQTHLSKGHTVVVCSSATRYQVEPAARELGVTTVITTQLEVVDGLFTGDVVRPTLWGGGKADAVSRLCEERGIKLADSYFYADGSEDLALMKIIGNPRPTNPHRKMREVATSKGWTVYDFSSRGTPTWTDIMRTSAGLWSLIPSVMSVVPLAIFGRPKQEVINTLGSLWADTASAAFGLKLDVNGRENLTKSLPCVYILNHQSGADFFVALKLIRRNFTGVAKHEMREGALGGLFEWAGVAMIDRSNSDEAIKQVNDLAKRVHSEKLSIAIFPEGTRSHTTKLGVFKKGAFKIAMGCGVPIVPIVLHNSVDVQQRKSRIFRPATVKIDVLEPIDVSSWTEENLDQHLASVRQLFLETLGQA